MKKRNVSIDIYKGILTAMMVLAHCLQFFVYLHETPVARLVSDYVNLTTFSGFVVAFGFVSYHAYLKKDISEVRVKIGKNAFKLLLAFYISSFAYVIFRQHAFTGLETVIDLLLINRLAGYSEFLLSFVFLVASCLLLHPLLKNLTPKKMTLLIAISLATTFVPYTSVHPVIGTLIGGTNFAYFSVTQYYFLFVIGIAFAKYNIIWHKWIFSVAMLLSLLYLVVNFFFFAPSRFPVSALFMLGATGFIYLYYLLAQKIQFSKVGGIFEQIGKQSLYYLLLSNIFIFALTNTAIYRGGVFVAVSLFIAIMLVSYYLKTLLIKPKN